MTYNVFGGTLSLTQSINLADVNAVTQSVMLRIGRRLCMEKAPIYPVNCPCVFIIRRRASVGTRAS